MSLAAIDVRDLVGQPGGSRRVRIAGTLDQLGTELARVREDDRIEGDLLLESLVEGVLVSGTLSGAHGAAVRAVPEGLRATIRGRGARDVRAAPDEDTDDYLLDPEGRSSPSRWSATRSVSSCRSRRCAAPSAWGCARCAAATATSASAPGHRAVDPRCAVLSEQLLHHEGSRTERQDHDRRGTTDGRPEEEAEQDPQRQARATWKASAPSYAACPQCKQPKLPHRVCANCGYYAGRQAVEVE